MDIMVHDDLLDKILQDKKQREKYIKNIEKVIRNSFEYKKFISWLKTEMALNFCSVFNNMPDEIKMAISIEIHHLYLTLYDMVDILLTKYQTDNIPINPLSISNDIMMAHYNNDVSLISLSKTMHELYHSNPYFIPKELIFGSNKFWEEYKQYASEETTMRVLDNIETDLNVANFLELNKKLLMEK